ncbi:MAG: helix-hairpin-helix domain-containing protein [Alphaproteobacteria bacterium]|nr:helix-hairpin-helix domain-containing protein [Alphaproteobacteria bacterium]
MTMARGVALSAWLLLAGAAEAADDRLLLNQATSEQLAALPGVDATTAQAVVALRTARGRLGSLEELRVLPGLADETLGALREGTWVDLELTASATRTFETVDDVLAAFAHEPAVSEVQRWASAYAQVRPETVQRWLAASRGFAALPQVRFEYRVADDYGNDFEYFTPTGPVSTSQDDGVAVQTDADVGQTRTILVRAAWDLDKLVMSSEQIRVINEAQDVVKLREKVLGEVTRLYFERRRLQVDVLLAPKRDLMGQVRDELRLAELTASLDAYTGGRFSESLQAAPAR